MANRKPNGKTKVLIVGGGASGMACAATLAKAPHKFEVTVVERNNYIGGQAKAIPIDGDKYGADWINTGAQGGPGLFKHTFAFFQEYGYEAQEVATQCSFGKGQGNFWTNVFPTDVSRKYQKEIRKFGRLLTLIRRVPLLWPIPFKIILPMFNFSEGFMNQIIYPVAAMFFGIGNQGKDAPCGHFENLFRDPLLKMWDYDAETFIPFLPKMFVYPNMSRFHADWAAGLCAQGVTMRTNTEVVSVLQRNKDGVVVETRSNDADSRISLDGYYDRNMTEAFDKIVFAVPANEAKNMLGKLATRRENYILGSVRFVDDLTITHNDYGYFQKKYETQFRDKDCAAPQTAAEEEQIKFAKGEKGPQSGFKPTYCTFSYESRRDKLELACDLSSFQYQFQPDSTTGSSCILPECHLFQSHFMDEKVKDLWTIDHISEVDIIDRQWWRQVTNHWKHYIKVVPGMRFINGRNNTLYAGAWTWTGLLEIAMVSGVAAAYQLGAPYEKIDDVADGFFNLYLRKAYGKSFKRG